MRVNGAELDRILTVSAADPHLAGPGLWRSLYGNLSASVKHDGAIQRDDVKLHSIKALSPEQDFLSTDERTAKDLLQLLRDKFPERSPWEKR
jgi:hypothetical protein